MKFLRTLICRVGGHNLSPAAGAFAARCTFCDAQFAELNNDQGASGLALRHRAQALPAASQDDRNEGRVSAVR